MLCIIENWIVLMVQFWMIWFCFVTKWSDRWMLLKFVINYGSIRDTLQNVISDINFSVLKFSHSIKSIIGQIINPEWFRWNIKEWACEQEQHKFDNHTSMDG